MLVDRTSLQPLQAEAMDASRDTNSREDINNKADTNSTEATVSRVDINNNIHSKPNKLDMANKAMASSSKPMGNNNNHTSSNHTSNMLLFNSSKCIASINRRDNRWVRRRLFHNSHLGRLLLLRMVRLIITMKRRGKLSGINLWECSKDVYFGVLLFGFWDDIYIYVVVSSLLSASSSSSSLLGLDKKGSIRFSSSCRRCCASSSSRRCCASSSSSCASSSSIGFVHSV
mmetsp:Transcript_34895/g.46864  ORF Transcript_34895/g.46864 Transcript_34895/m.46864 type:complete len:229 (-) Transcript_34895:596-1282(-)